MLSSVKTLYAASFLRILKCLLFELLQQTSNKKRMLETEFLSNEIGFAKENFSSYHVQVCVELFHNIKNELIT